MRQIIYVKYNRTRSEKFQLKTAIVRENGALSVEKTALTEAGAGHMGSFWEKYQMIREQNPVSWSQSLRTAERPSASGIWRERPWQTPWRTGSIWARSPMRSWSGSWPWCSRRIFLWTAGIFP